MSMFKVTPVFNFGHYNFINHSYV